MGKNFRQFAIGYNLALKFGIMVSCPVLGSLFAGIFLDKKLGTTPWIMLALMVVGLGFSVYAVYRVATRTQDSNQTTEES
ncbi:MAG: AtpZ/AtpI family protein [Anaerolineae bacterium]